MTDAGRLAIGLAALAADRIRGTVTSDTRLATAVGLAQEGALTARRLAGVPRRALRRAATLPGAGVVGAPLRRMRDRLDRRLADARALGRATVAASRAEAMVFVRSTVDDGVAWARATVLPQIIDDLAADPRIRALVVEQSRGALGEAAAQVRTRTATADDRVDSAFRRLFGNGPGDAPPSG